MKKPVHFYVIGRSDGQNSAEFLAKYRHMAAAATVTPFYLHPEGKLLADAEATRTKASRISMIRPSPFPPSAGLSWEFDIRSQGLSAK